MANEVAATGIEGLDIVLRGGLPKGQLYLVEGDPGAGKTTLAMQFLMEGIRQGDAALYVTLSETVADIHDVARSHGWKLNGLVIHEMMQGAVPEPGEDQYTVFHPSEVELGETTKRILDKMESVKPSRMVIDSLSELRLLAQDPLRYRRQILGFRQYFAGRNCTVLMLDDRTVQQSDHQPRSVAHGVIELDRMPSEYGAERRRLIVSKVRGHVFSGGYHDFTIATGGVTVFPRLSAVEGRAEFKEGPSSTGSDGFDLLLGGGLDRGTSTLFTGPAGTGKSTLAMKVVDAAAKRGEKAAIFAFEENNRIVKQRARAMNVSYEDHVKKGLVTFRHLDPAEMSPGEFAWLVRDAVEKSGVSTVIIDSLNGYLNAMPEERFLTAQLHELMAYLNGRGVVTVMILAQPGAVHGAPPSPVDVSYLADCVVMIRHFEAFGGIRKAISVLKKRTGHHEDTIRELQIDKEGLRVGGVLKDFQGVLTGVPEYVGTAVDLNDKEGASLR